jgi:predicted esterase
MPFGLRVGLALTALSVFGCGGRLAPLDPDVPAHYEIRLPEMYDPDESYPVVIILHDAGRTEAQVTDLWDRGWFYLPDFIMVAVRAPFQSGSGFSWLKEDPAEEPASLVRRSARTSELAILDVLEQVEEEFSVDADWRFVSGLGQGAGVAFYTAFRHAELFQGVAGFGSGIDTVLFERRSLRGIRDMDVFADVPLDEELLNQAGANVAVRESGPGQTLTPSALRAMQNFFGLAEEEAPETDALYPPAPAEELDVEPVPDPGE